MSNKIQLFIKGQTKAPTLLMLLTVICMAVQPVYAETPFKNLSLLNNEFKRVLPGYIIHPDGERVIFQADKDTAYEYEIYVTRITGGAITKLSKSLVNGGEIRSFKLSPDGNYLAYVASADTLGKFELYVVPISGGPSVTVGETMQGLDDASDYAFTDDSTKIVYLADTTATELENLYISPIDGTTRLQINPTPVAGGEVRNFKLSPDGVKVVFKGDMDEDQVFNLYQCNLDATDCSTLSTGHPNEFVNSKPSTYEVSSVEPRVVYLASEDYRTNIFSVTLDGGAPVRLTSAPHLGRITDFRITKDGSKVVFTGTHLDHTKNELFWTPIEISDVARINGSLPEWGDVQSFQLANDSDTVVYLANQDVVTIQNLYSKKMSNSLPATRISNAASGVTESYLLTPDSTKVIYVHRIPPDGSSGSQLYVSEINKAPSTFIGGKVGTRTIKPVAIDPLSKLVIVLQGDFFNSTSTRVNLSGSNEIHRFTQASPFAVTDHKITPSGSHLLFLYGTRFPAPGPGGPRRAVDLISVTNLGETTGICAPVSTKNNSIVPICL